jgi:hypothetical protein
MLSVNNVVKVSISVSAGSQAAKSFAGSLLLGNSAVLPSDGRIVSVSASSDLVAYGFTTASPEYLFADEFFSATAPPDFLLVGARFPSGAPAHLTCGTVGNAANLAALPATAVGAFKITVDGTLLSIASLNFSTHQDTWAHAATVIDTALNAALSGCHCKANAAGTGIIITSPTAGAGGSVTVLSAPSSGTDVSALLDGTAATGAKIIAGVAAETATDSCVASLNFNPNFYHIAGASDTTEADKKLISAFAESNRLHYYGATESLTYGADSNTLVATNRARSTVIYSWADPNNAQNINAHAAVMGFYCTTLFDQAGGIKVGMFKNLPGISASPLTQQQLDQMCGKNDGTGPGWNINTFATIGTASIYYRGMNIDGTWTDQGIALDWLQNQLQVAVFSAFQAAPLVPGTDAGVLYLEDAMTPVFNKCLSNGLIAGGTWNGAVTVGQVNNGDPVPAGYYVYAPPVSSQTSAQRTARQCPPMTAILIGAGALQGASILIDFQP